MPSNLSSNHRLSHQASTDENILSKEVDL